MPTPRDTTAERDARRRLPGDRDDHETEEDTRESPPAAFSDGMRIVATDLWRLHEG